MNRRRMMMQQISTVTAEKSNQTEKNEVTEEKSLNYLEGNENADEQYTVKEDKS